MHALDLYLPITEKSQSVSLCVCALGPAAPLTLQLLTHHMGASPCSTNTWEHHWLVALLIMDGAGDAFLQWGSGFISPSSSGLCVLVAGKGFKASLVGRLSFWAESKLKVDPPFIRQWQFQCGIIKHLPSSTSLEHHLLFNHILPNIVWVSLAEGSTLWDRSKSTQTEL